jgi:hypothetical protein
MPAPDLNDEAINQHKKLAMGKPLAKDPPRTGQPPDVAQDRGKRPPGISGPPAKNY